MSWNRWWHNLNRRLIRDTNKPDQDPLGTDRNPQHALPVNSDPSLDEDELEQIAGGLAGVRVPICSQCNHRTAVSGMKICAECFRKSNSADSEWKG
ncbi:MAG: hypothetical protein P0Y55_01025 [Candidatus Cohnella colombiensis]|uniref:Uncharacterized protein n=1 Tax=Candidatus Cohnella colombiensis TaxID=3121368 RepID=A0AA95EXC7_9BACL|nr:MAG: hypothetical protein P0Y55_01025 [Cohnella sp.]